MIEYSGATSHIFTMWDKTLCEKIIHALEITDGNRMPHGLIRFYETKL